MFLSEGNVENLSESPVLTIDSGNVSIPQFDTVRQILRKSEEYSLSDILNSETDDSLYKTDLSLSTKRRKEEMDVEVEEKENSKEKSKEGSKQILQHDKSNGDLLEREKLDFHESSIERRADLININNINFNSSDESIQRFYTKTYSPQGSENSSILETKKSSEVFREEEKESFNKYGAILKKGGLDSFSYPLSTSNNKLGKNMQSQLAPIPHKNITTMNLNCRSNRANLVPTREKHALLFEAPPDISRKGISSEALSFKRENNLSIDSDLRNYSLTSKTQKLKSNNLINPIGRPGTATDRSSHNILNDICTKDDWEENYPKEHKFVTPEDFLLAKDLDMRIINLNNISTTNINLDISQLPNISKLPIIQQSAQSKHRKISIISPLIQSLHTEHSEERQSFDSFDQRLTNLMNKNNIKIPKIVKGVDKARSKSKGVALKNCFISGEK